MKMIMTIILIVKIIVILVIMRVNWKKIVLKIRMLLVKTRMLK